MTADDKFVCREVTVVKVRRFLRRPIEMRSEIIITADTEPTVMVQRVEGTK